MSAQKCPTTFKECTLFNDEHRDVVRALIDSRISVSYSKYSAGLFSGLLVFSGLIFYTYNQGNTYTDEKLNVLINQAQNQTVVNSQLLIAINEIKYVKKNLTDFKTEVRAKFIALDKERK